jgi:serine/threonine protein kinase
MDGGALIGKGSYGCVFVPPLLCKSDYVPKGKMVGKLTMPGDAAQEIKIANRLRQFPLHRNYFVLPEPETCIPAEREKQKDANLASHKCTPLNGPDHRLEYKDTVQMFIPFGGSSFYKVLKSSNIHPSRFDFLGFMKHMLQAGGSLALSGVVHYDIYPPNILIDDKGVPRIIDFGISFVVQDIDKRLLETHWKELDFGLDSNVVDEVLDVEPPEITIMNAMLEKYSLDEAIKLTVAGKPAFRNTEKYLGKARSAMEAELHEFWQTSKAAMSKDWVTCWKLYWPAIDAWSLGAIFLNLLKSQLTWPEFSQGIWRQHEKRIRSVLLGLLDPSPRLRLDCIEALHELDPENTWLKRFGQTWLQKRKEQRAKEV